MKALLALIAVLAWPGALVSQAAPRTIAGVVQDSAGHGLADAVVVLDPNDKRRAVQTDAQGRFRFDRVNPGHYQLRTVCVAFEADDRVVDVPASGLDVTIVLAVIPVRLDTIRIVARREGLFGTTVERADLRALGGTEVIVVGTRFRARTGPNGRFAFGALRPGGYVVRASRNGFRTLFLSVAVPQTDGVEVSLAMDSLTTRADKFRESLLSDMRFRVDRRSATNSAFVPQHELAGRGGTTLDVALMYAPAFLLKGLQIMNEECVFVNGRFARGMHLRDFPADNVAMVEIYGTSPEAGSIEKVREFMSKNGTVDCGYWSRFRQVGATNSRTGLKTDINNVEPPLPGLVHMAYIWLKEK